jgi:hypothetical protein
MAARKDNKEDSHMLINLRMTRMTRVRKDNKGNDKYDKHK